MHPTRSLVSIALASMAFAGIAHAADVAKADQDFMMKAAGGGIFEVEAALIKRLAALDGIVANPHELW